MRIALSILTFIFLGVAAGRVIPEFAVRDSAIKGLKRDQGNPSDPPHSFNPSGLSDRPEPTGKHPHPTASCSDAPTGVPLPSVIPSNVSGQPQPTYSRAGGVRRDAMSSSPPGTPSGTHPPPPSGFPSGFPSGLPSDFSDHPMPSGKHAHSWVSGMPDPTGIHSHHHHHHRPSGFPSGSSDYPMPTSSAV